MPNFSFDIVSELNMSEINNVFDQAKREIEIDMILKTHQQGLTGLRIKKVLKYLVVRIFKSNQL